MGASAGVGALIVGVAMLSVFVLANSALDAQVESGLDIIEKSTQQVAPSFKLDDASNDVNALNAVSINTVGAGYTTGGVLTASTLDSITVVDAGTGYSADTLDFTGSTCGTTPVGSYTVNGGVIDVITITNFGLRCTVVTVEPSDAGNGDADLQAVLAASLGFSATYIVSTGQVSSLTVLSAGQGFSRVPTLTTSESGVTITDATFTVTVDNVLTFNVTNDGNLGMEVSEMWFSLDGGTPKQLESQTYSEWGFPKYGVVFPGETLMVVFDLSSEADITPERVALTCMGGFSGKAVVENS